MTSVTTFDFFQTAELPVPTISVGQAEAIAAEHFGLEVTATALGSQQDANFLLRRSSGEAIGVLKIANPVFSRVELEAQDAAAAFIESGEGIRTAKNVDLPGTTPIARIHGETPLYARILTFLPGGTLGGDGYLNPARVAAMGALSGRICRALANFEHPGVDRVLQWDLRHAMRTIETLASHVTEPHRRDALESAARKAWRTVAGLSLDLPAQVIHGDVTGDNVVCGAPDSHDLRGQPDGIIDFGDLMRSWTVAELAVTVSGVLLHEGGEPATAIPAIEAFHSIRPLSPAEVEALWPLVVLRAAVVVVSGVHQTSIDADNAYATERMDHEWQMFKRATRFPAEVMTAQIRHALGAARPVETIGVEFRLIDGLDSATVAELDLSAESDAVDFGVWLDPDCEDRLAAEALSDGAAAVVTRFGQARLTRSSILSTDSPATVATGVHLWPSGELAVTAPWSGVVDSSPDGSILTLTAVEGTLELRGAIRPETASSVSAGAALGVVHGPVWIQCRRSASLDVPSFVTPEYAAGWLDQVSDPAVLLGLSPAVRPVDDNVALRQRRARSYAQVQEHYYDNPPRIERGWREHLIATDGRVYLDMVNNVAAIGHGHPALAEAVARQWRRLNTNSRFNYAAVVALSERLAATLPDPLDTVFLVNSGSEADDLALRLAMATTGRHDIVAVAEAYHGWTYATDAISTSIADNPNALSTRPPWVHTVPSPNAFRGQHRGVDASKYAPEAVEIIENLAAQGNPPAAFLCEPFYGNAGGMALPDGYLKAVYAAVRAAGGLAIADEVQVGYGRTGRWFWAFEQQDVVPDIVCVAKAMGNGQPLGAVITTKAIADAYRTQGYFFSSAGGSPVSSVVGLTVLDVIERERLQENALIVGDHLKARINELATRHELIGTVHGSGLYMGVELVRDRSTLEPAVSETAEICERMRELGVIVQPTGDRQNVLKMKPPMCLTREGADFFVEMLDRVLSTGW